MLKRIIAKEGKRENRNIEYMEKIKSIKYENRLKLKYKIITLYLNGLNITANGQKLSD